MAEYVILTDSNGTRRVVLKSNRTMQFIQKNNAVQGQENKFTIGETFPNEELANKFVADNQYDNEHNQTQKEALYKGVVKSQKTEIEQLKAQIQSMSMKSESEAPQPLVNVADTLLILKDLKTIKEVNKLLEGEERATIINAANKLITKLS